jgi:ferredoxin
VRGDAAAPYYDPKGTGGQPVNFLKAKPKTHLKKCTRCGACARMCPMGAIDMKDFVTITGTCIKCQRCVRKCTKGAKYFDDPAMLDHIAMLEQEFSEPKENEVFL